MIVSPLGSLRPVAQDQRGDLETFFTLACLYPEVIFCTAPSDHPAVLFGGGVTTNFFGSSSISTQVAQNP